MEEKPKLSRRGFLGVTAAAGAVIGVSGAGGLAESVAAENGTEGSSLQYIRTTCSPNCTGACGIIAAVEDGEIKTLIQAADYPDEEYNPRGCLKGLSFTNLLYGPDRLTKPLIRTGERGEGKFKEVSWEEALDHCAERLKEVAEKYGPESVGVNFQVGGTGYVHKGAMVSLATMAGWSLHHPYDMNGDLPMFWPMTFGVQTEELEPLEWLESRYVAVFGSNILATRLPDAHFLVEARNRGAKFVVVDPNYTPTAAKADEWVRIKPSSDAALALGMANVMVDEDLIDRDFLKTYTDMPLLVRMDNHKRLTASEVKGLAAPKGMPAYRQAFVAYNGSLVVVDPEKLDLPGDVELEKELDIELVDGSKVRVTTVFNLLKKSLSAYTPEAAEEESGVPADDVVRLARDMAGTGPLHIVYGASNYQWYHGDLKGRAVALLAVLTGNIGKSGAGISTYAGQYRVRLKLAKWWFPNELQPKWFPFLYFLHGPTDDMKAPAPKNGIKALVSAWGNPFDQHNMGNRLREMADKNELEFIVSCDFQMTTSCKYADVVLPGVTWYEKTELVATPVHPYLQLQQKVVETKGEGKPELWIFRELAKRLDPGFAKHYFPELDHDEAAKKVIDLLLENGGPTVAGITRAQLEKGPVRMHSEAPGDRQLPFYEQIEGKKPFPPVSLPAKIEKTAQFVKSGRIEFYKDEDTFIKLGETLPVHKPPFVESEWALDPEAKDKYTFAFITRNALYRVHSTHSNNPWMNELQDGKPRVWLNPDDAAEKGIADGEHVEVYNGRGSLKAFVVIDQGVGRKNLVFEQGWWSKYTEGTSYNSLTYPFIKPTNEVYFVPGMWAPNTSWNECLCDVRKAGEQR